MDGTNDDDGGADDDDRVSVTSGRTDRTETGNRRGEAVRRSPQKGMPAGAVVAPVVVSSSSSSSKKGGNGYGSGGTASASVSGNGNGSVMGAKQQQGSVTSGAPSPTRPSVTVVNPNPTKSPSLMTRLSERLTRSRSEKREIK